MTRRQREILYWKKITNRGGSIFGKGESSSFLSLPLLFSHFSHSSPPPSLFFGDYSTMYLPVETAATRCYDPNTAVWCDDWLREGAGVGGVVQHIRSRTSAEAPLKFKHLYKLEMDPFLLSSNYVFLFPPSSLLSLSYYSIIPFGPYSYLSLSDIFPHPYVSVLGSPPKKWGNENESDGKRERNKNMKEG